jgi:hypothetical protein
MQDTRASWCSLPYAHDSHGPNSKEPCPGWAGNPPHSKGERMPHGITKVLVESVVNSLNEKVERLGWLRRYEFVAGSSANGVKHVIQTRLPHLQHPTDAHPFNTLSKVHQYLLAMGQVLSDAVAERERQRATVRGGAMSLTEAVARPDYPIAGGFVDPDARSATRPNEGFRNGRPIF